MSVLKEGLIIRYNGEKYICKKALNKDHPCSGCCFYKFGQPCMCKSKDMQCMDSNGNDFIWVKEEKE